MVVLIMTIILWNFFNSILPFSPEPEPVVMMSDMESIYSLNFTTFNRSSGDDAGYETILFSLFVVEILPISPESAVE